MIFYRSLSRPSPIEEEKKWYLLRFRELNAGNYEEPNMPRGVEQFDLTAETNPKEELVDFEEFVIVLEDDKPEL